MLHHFLPEYERKGEKQTNSSKINISINKLHLKKQMNKTISASFASLLEWDAGLLLFAFPVPLTSNS